MIPRTSLIPIAMILSFIVLAVTAQAAPEEEPAPQPVIPTLTGRLAYPYRDHAVLQQNLALPVWGTACLPDTRVTVRFNGQNKETVANAQGGWRVTLDPMAADKLQSVNESPEGREMVIAFEKDGEKAATTLKDLLIGEVWLCAGQSNMAGSMRTNTSRHFPENSIETATYPAFRQLVSPNDGNWLVCSPETASEFKKVCFFFGRRVYNETLVPIGVINAAVGGSNIESWLNQQPYETGGNYTNMIVPLIPFGIRGVIWYQGESNAKQDGYGYLPKLTSLIHGWRKAWNQPDSGEQDGPRSNFSFYYVQLPGIGESDKSKPEMGDGRAGIRRAFFETLEVENTGMAICHDIGAKGEHPPNKYDTGFRLAQLALHHDYGKKDLIPSGPLYKSHNIEGSSIRIHFDCAEGLMVATKEGFPPAKPSPEAKLGWLSIQSKDGTWHWADGKIDGSELIVSSPEVNEPVAVRYAHTNNPNGPLLYNRDGLPAAPFATDEQVAAEGK
jgi:sialate O-acetylesterase